MFKRKNTMNVDQDRRSHKRANVLFHGQEGPLDDIQRMIRESQIIIQDRDNQITKLTSENFLLKETIKSLQVDNKTLLSCTPQSLLFSFRENSLSPPPLVRNGDMQGFLNRPRI